jgi:LPXTG-site transpeptidase (sortase) family protein
VRLRERISGILGAVKEGLSNAKARLHLPGVRVRRSMAIVAGIVLCGAVALVPIGVLKSQLANDDSVATGDLREIIAPSGHEEASPAATVTPLPEVAAPMRMVIEKMGVDAPIITVGLDANRLPEAPNGPDVVAWYDFSVKPGQGSNAVFSGHVDWTVNSQPVTAVFWGLGELEEGDVVKLLLEDGGELRYRVTDNATIKHDDPDGVKVMDKTPTDVITLISCGGTWVPDRSMALGGNYTHRVVVRAELVGVSLGGNVAP